MRPNVENDLRSLTKGMIVTNGCLCEMYIDVICELIWFYCQNNYTCFNVFMQNDVFIDKLISWNLWFGEKDLSKGILLQNLIYLTLGTLTLKKRQV